jgi:hypothetical protein
MAEVDSLDNLLEQARDEAGFVAVILTDMDGKIVASARDDDTSPEMLGALLDIAMRITKSPEERAKLVTAGESAFFDWEGRQVVCRWLDKPQPRLFVILAPRGKAYKRVLSTLVKAVQQKK